MPGNGESSTSNKNPLSNEELNRKIDDLEISLMAIEPNEANSVYELKLPPFYMNNPMLWFHTIESQFATRKITNDKTMYNHIVGNLDERAAQAVTSIIMEPYADGKYNRIKRALIDNFSKSSTERIKQLLSDVTLGDRKPSKLLYWMKEQAGNTVSDEFIKGLWMQRLPEIIRQILSASKDDLNNLARMADQIYNSTDNRFNACAVKDSKNLTLDSLCAKIEENFDKLNVRLKSLESNSHNSRRDSTPRARDRSKSNNRKSESNKNDTGMCFYHERYGEDAKKCREPCAFKKQQQKN